MVLGNSLYDKNSVEQYLKNILEESNKRKEFEFEYKAGHTAFHSRVYIKITFFELIYEFLPRGTPLNPLEEEKRKLIQRIKLSKAASLNFIKGLLENSVWELKNCTDIVEPDTALLTFTIKKMGNIIWEAKVWESCRYQDEQTKKIITLISKISPKEPMAP